MTKTPADNIRGVAPVQPTASETEVAVDYEHSAHLGSLLESLQVSILLSTYQAGKLVAIGTIADKPTFSFHSFDQVMGVAVGRDRIAIGARRQIHFLRASHDVARSLPPVGTFDGCFLTRTSITTGSIHGHDLVFGQEGLWVVNTLFSCLCTLDEEFNFFPRWRPPFVSQLIGQDRCHLNGLALEQGRPRYVTVLGVTDEPAGWRANKKGGGAILDVASGEVVSRGLCMPHSPRIHLGKLWVLNSGCGELSTVDTDTGKVEAVASLPGYTRGLSFFGNYAFIGLSRIRETNVFGGLPIGEHPERLHCGLGIVELLTGRTVATLRFKTGVEELFAVEVLPGFLNPKISGPSSLPDAENEIWIVPPSEVQTMAPRISLGAKSPSHASASASTASITGPAASTGLGVAEWIHQSNAADASGDKLRAVQLLHRAVSVDPGSAVAWNQLGNLHQDLNDQDKALRFYQQAIVADPSFAPAHQNLGVLWTVNNEPLRALHHFERAQTFSPHPVNKALAAKVLPVVYQNASQVKAWRDRFSLCVKSLVAEGVRIDTARSLADTSFYLAYQGENDREIMAELGKVYFGQECVPRGIGHRPKGKKIKVGFLSAYFRDHTIGRLNLGRIRGLSREQFDVSVITLSNARDPMAEAFRKAADRCLAVPRQVDVARRAIVDLELDILVFADIGMDAATQSLSYSRMAPIQAMTWGHPVTSGSPAIDYFVSSKLADSIDSQHHYTEQLALLDHLGVYYERPQLTGSKRTKESFGLNSDNHTYLCPQTSFKFHPLFDEALREILEADPLGELVVIEGRVAAWTQCLKQRWNSAFPDGLSRVRFLKPLPQPEFLHLLACSDVVLDPYPFCGGNTSYEALAVGTPVITYPSPFLRGRLTEAMYRRMGLDAFIARDLHQYVKAAVLLGTDPDKNRSARRAIESQSGILFEQQEEIADWERLFHEWSAPNHS